MKGISKRLERMYDLINEACSIGMDVTNDLVLDLGRGIDGAVLSKQCVELGRIMYLLEENFNCPHKISFEFQEKETVAEKVVPVRVAYADKLLGMNRDKVERVVSAIEEFIEKDLTFDVHENGHIKIDMPENFGKMVDYYATTQKWRSFPDKGVGMESLLQYLFSGKEK